MRLYNKVLLAALAGGCALLPFVRCTRVDDRLGSGFEGSDQQMKLGTATFDLTEDDERPYFETRLFQTDSIKASNLGRGYFGMTSDARFGSRRAGFLAQYRAVALSDTEGFGFRPIFDSIQLKLFIQDYAGDTLQPIRYNVYEVVSNDYLDPSLPAPAGAARVADTVFMPTFDPTPYLDPEPVFTFTFPDGRTTGPLTEYVTLQPTERGMGLVRRLMLLEGGYDMDLYNNLDRWTEHLKGLYIAPAEEVAGRGNLFATQLDGSGMLLFARNRNEKDPTLIQDTVTASYSFMAPDGAKYSNASVNTIRHDYTGSVIDLAAADEHNPERPLSATVYVEGMAGVVTELTFEDVLFEQFEKLYEGITDESGKPYRSIALSRARLMIYLPGSDYVWENIDAATLLPALEDTFVRLGLYTDYKRLTAVADYAYAYERTYAGEGFVLPYGGYLNRGRGVYTMDISLHLQALWNEWLKMKTGETIASPLSRSVYIAPEAYGLYTMPYTVAQGMQSPGNNASVRLELVYALIK